MKGKFGETLNELEKSIENLQSQGISIESLEKSFADLKKQTSNIAKVEENIEAIREEVIDRIKDELDQNKRAGKFSIFGFWIGAIALVLSIFSSISTLNDNQYQNIPFQGNQKDNTKANETFNNISEKIDILNDRVERLTYKLIGFDDYYVPTKNEFIIHAGYSVDPKTILKTKENHTLKIKVSDVSEKEENGKITPRAFLSFYVDDSKIGLAGIKRIVQVNNSNSFWYENNKGELIVNELDTIKLFELNYVIERIYRKQSKNLVIADDKNAILLKQIIKDSIHSK